MPKTFAEFESAYPETVKQFRAEASASASSLTEAVAAKDTELRLLRDELRETKTANAGQAEMLKELVETARSQKAEIAAARLKTDVAEALDAFVVGRRAGAMIKSNVMEELAEGRISDVAAAVKRAEKFAGVADAASALPLGGAAGGETAKRNVSEASDGGVEVTETRAGASAKLKALIGGRA
jgi:HPt (histidine-containing phosphotransfer) domain-containing protein